MTLRIYDTRSRALRDFEPLRPGQVGIYVCGPTVQSPAHVGHLRSAIAFDVLRRWLLESGYEVTLVRNVTDIDDKVLVNAVAAGRPWWELATANTRLFNEVYDAVGVLPPSMEPRATGHVPDMVELIARLLELGHAYATGDGNVWFDVRSWPAYGELSGQRPDAMQGDAADAVAGKRDPLDFALWKASRPDEPESASWETPWGRGRPGWHIECSAMARRYLGAEFDIHGGGLDLQFPHHENELAQSTAAGDGFARYWMHHGLLNAGAEKMSKSLGNFQLASDALAEVRPVVFRYAMLAPHYRSVTAWTDEVLTEAATAYGRLETFVRNATEIVGGVEPVEGGGSATWHEFAAAMDDDLGVPQGLAVIHGAVRAGNSLLEAGGDRMELAAVLAVVRRMLAVLGLEPGQWPAADGGGRLTAVVDELVQLALSARAEARARKDFTAADEIRDRLVAAGVVVEDTPAGARWRLAGE
ncbi:MAG: cysteinyl-tRNA synthetase [Frankiaceae bacterium]|nr:cysteinyl-tRNA synthetase [Frankiaceae bacterium]